MKTLLIILLTVFLSSLLYATELEWVDEQIEAIKPPRKGVTVVKVKDPFIFLDKSKPEVKKGAKTSSVVRRTVSSSKAVAVASPEKSVKKDTFVLSAIINLSAMINGNWYKKNDNISNYTITDIDKTSVTLKKGDKKLILSTISRNSNLKFKNK
ncbi:MAG: hypothetical protein C0628_06860 [Sulfurimonas sp.]|jgi:hypothetical protein|nr:MAG: hypothetical protein C0628_06860 [Sulfurimonas sp.]